MSALAAWDWPEERAEQVRCLEVKLRSPDLAKIAAQFAAVAGDPQTSPLLADLLGGKLTAVLQRGLSILDTAELRLLIQHPSRLIELQIQIQEQGGPYWHNTPETAEEFAAQQARRARLLARLDEDSVSSTTVYQTAIGRPVRRSRLRLLSATAAALIVGVFLGTLWRGTSSGSTIAWGWNKPNAMPQQASREGYLQALANSADEWFREQPTTATKLATRILQFREGCSRLLLSEHAPLPTTDREWLRERCRAWAKSLDDTLAELEASGDTAAAQSASDTIVRKLSDALRTRSAATSA